MALKLRSHTKELIFPSDRGSQCGSGAFRSLLWNAGITQSMSRRANPYDNARTESFMGTLKNEMLRKKIIGSQGKLIGHPRCPGDDGSPK